MVLKEIDLVFSLLGVPKHIFLAECMIERWIKVGLFSTREGEPVILNCVVKHASTANIGWCKVLEARLMSGHSMYNIASDIPSQLFMITTK